MTEVGSKPLVERLQAAAQLQADSIAAAQAAAKDARPIPPSESVGDAPPATEAPTDGR